MKFLYAIRNPDTLEYYAHWEGRFVTSDIGYGAITWFESEEEALQHMPRGYCEIVKIYKQY